MMIPFTIYLRTKFHTPFENGLLVIPVKLKTGYKFSVAAKWFIFYKKLHIFKDLQPHLISESCIK
jgi:hypothetical protein